MICIIGESNYLPLFSRIVFAFDSYYNSLNKTQIGFILRLNFNKIFAMKTRLFKLKVIAYTQ